MAMQLCFSSVGNKPVRMAVIFRGTGKRIPADELAAYHKDVYVYRQPNAWVDTSMSVQWIKGTLSAAVADFDEFILFCDNLEAQRSLPFQEEIRELKGVVWYGVPNVTDIWQPVDAGAGFLIKKLILHEQQRWLEEEGNVELLLGKKRKGLGVKERIILLTHWIGEAYNRFLLSEYDTSRYRGIETTGCLITADGSEDSKIPPEGLNGFIVPDPLPSAISVPDPVPCKTPGPATILANDEMEIEDSEFYDNSVDAYDDEILEVDDELDRNFEHKLVGHKLKVHHNYGWFTGGLLSSF